MNETDSDTSSQQTIEPERFEDRMVRLATEYAHQARYAEDLRISSPEYQRALDALAAASIELCRADNELYAHRSEAHDDNYMVLRGDLRDAKFIQREAADVVYELYRQHVIKIGEMKPDQPDSSESDS